MSERGERYILGMDVGGTYIRAGIVNSSNKVVREKIVETAGILGAARDCGAFANWTAGFIRESGLPVGAISMGLPAILDKQRRIVLSAPNVNCLQNQPVVDIFEQQLKIRTFIEKDACILLYYDLNCHRIPREGTIIGIYIGTGIGNALLIQGAPYVGWNGVACEIGHTPCMDKDDVCTCGNHACTEVYASGRALETLCRESFPQTAIGDVFTVHGKDPRLMQMVKRFAVPIATEINILDPDYVVLGGGVLAMRDFPKKALEEAILSYCRKPLPAENLRLLYSVPSQHNGIIGAALYAGKKLQEQC